MTLSPSGSCCQTRSPPQRTQGRTEIGIHPLPLCSSVVEVLPFFSSPISGEKQGRVSTLSLALSHHSRSPQIVQMHNPQQRPASIHHHQRSNFLLLHQCQRRRRKFPRRNRLRTRSHRLARRQIHRILPPLLQQPPQIAVTHNSHQLLVLHHCRHAQFLARHFINHIRHLRLRRHSRQGLSRVHQRLHPRQPLSQLSSGMQVGEVLFLESAALAQS